MPRDTFCFRFSDQNTFDDVRETLLLAVLAAEALHGTACVKLEAGFELDEDDWVCFVDATTTVGQTMARIITGLVQHQVGSDGYSVERVARRSLSLAGVQVGHA